jgi:hypothetical protein
MRCFGSMLSDLGKGCSSLSIAWPPGVNVFAKHTDCEVECDTPQVALVLPAHYHGNGTEVSRALAAINPASNLLVQVDSVGYAGVDHLRRFEDDHGFCVWET